MHIFFAKWQKYILKAEEEQRQHRQPPNLPIQPKKENRKPRKSYKNLYIRSSFLWCEDKEFPRDLKGGKN